MADSQRNSRRFTISDTMVLIASLAAGLAWTAQGWKVFQASEQTTHEWGILWKCTMLGSVMSLPCLLALTLGTIGLRIRRPRPSWRRVSRQPGTTACLAVLVGLAIAIPILAGWFAIQIRRSQVSSDELYKAIPGVLLEIMSMAAAPLGVSVLIVWLVLAIQGRWRRERSWIDRLGRIVGAAWIISGSVLGTEFMRLYAF